MIEFDRTAPIGMSRATALEPCAEELAERHPFAIDAALESTTAVLGRPALLAAFGDAAAPDAVIARWRHRAAAIDVIPQGAIRLAMSLTDGARAGGRGSGGHLADRVQAGSVTVFSATESSRILVSGEADVLQILWSPFFFERSAEAHFSLPPLSDVHDPLIQAAFMQLLAAGARSERDGHLQSAGALPGLVHRLRTLAAGFQGSAIGSAPAKGGLSPAAFRRVQGLVEASFTNAEGSTPSLADMAAVANLSTSHFLRAFRHHVGTTPHVFVMRRRMERALTLLRTGDGTIASIADRLGFSSPAHFGAAFRAVMGVTPGTVREALVR